MTETYFNEEESILYFKVKGDVTFEKMIMNVESFNDSTLPKNMKILEDSRLTNEAILDVSEFPEIADKLENVLVNFNSIRHAVVHEQPINCALAMQFNKRFKNSNIN